MKKQISILAVLSCICVAIYSVGDQRPSQQTTVVRRVFRGQTGSIPATTLFTPSESGVFRVSAYIELSNNAGGYFPEDFLSWTDDFASNQQAMGGVSGYGTTDGSAYIASQMLVTDVANQPIQLSTTVNPNEKGFYNLYVVVERL
jgi:hypothetical protein